MSVPVTAQGGCASPTSRLFPFPTQAGTRVWAVWGMGLLLAPLVLTACIHDKNVAVAQPALAPPIEDAPLPKPDSAPANLPPPVITAPVQTPPPRTNSPAQAETPPKAPVHHKKPAKVMMETASTGTPGVSAIGELSSGGAPDLQAQTRDSIGATERGLNGIARTLSDQEKKTAGQIREFLKQAKAALDSGDVDGARTLAAKARVLLNELTG